MRLPPRPAYGELERTPLQAKGGRLGGYFAEGAGLKPVDIRLQCGKEPLYQAALTPAVVVCVGPQAELLAIVAGDRNAAG